MKTIIKHYPNKLVRDKIPSKILERGGQVVLRKLDSEEAGPALISKMREEIDEFENDKTLEELANLYTVWESLVSAYGFCMNEVMNIVSEKKSINGDFSEGIFLKEYTEIVSIDEGQEDGSNDVKYEAEKDQAVSSLIEIFKSEESDKFYKSERIII